MCRSPRARPPCNLIYVGFCGFLSKVRGVRQLAALGDAAAFDHAASPVVSIICSATVPLYHAMCMTSCPSLTTLEAYMQDSRLEALVRTLIHCSVMVGRRLRAQSPVRTIRLLFILLCAGDVPA